MPRSGIAARLFLTAWLVYAAHLTSNVVRETYLAVAIGDRLSLRVDPFLGLHPDLFEIPGRGAYINSNPGASLVGAVPYALARPAIGLLFRLRPDLARYKPPTTFDDPRPNRTRLMNEMRARGLDVKLALAAFSMQLGLMAPLGALAAVVVFLFLRARLGDERRALWFALLYAFGTPIFFRTAFLNQNAIIAHVVLVAYVLNAWPGAAEDDLHATRRWIAVGALLGLAILCDYSGAALALVFGSWALAEGLARGGVGEALRRAVWYTLGAAGPIAVLLLYQWAAFGSPWYPAQRYMPATVYSVQGWHGLALPSAPLLWDNLFDLRFGLLAFCPMLLAAVAAPLALDRPGAPTRRELAFALLGCGALWLFSSANRFANLQWNTGIRYMVPAVPLLFFALVPVLLQARTWLRWTLVAPTVLVTWAVTTMREDIPTAFERLLRHGPELPMVTVLAKTASAYAAWLGGGRTTLVVLAADSVLAGALWLVWRVAGAATAPEGTAG